MLTNSGFRHRHIGDIKRNPYNLLILKPLTFHIISIVMRIQGAFLLDWNRNHSIFFENSFNRVPLLTYSPTQYRFHLIESSKGLESFTHTVRDRRLRLRSWVFPYSANNVSVGISVFDSKKWARSPSTLVCSTGAPYWSVIFSSHLFC